MSATICFEKNIHGSIIVYKSIIKDFLMWTNCTFATNKTRNMSYRSHQSKYNELFRLADLRWSANSVRFKCLSRISEKIFYFSARLFYDGKCSRSAEQCKNKGDVNRPCFTYISKLLNWEECRRRYQLIFLFTQNGKEELLQTWNRRNIR